MGIPDWNASMENIHLQNLLWLYCPGQTGVKGNDQTARVAGKATITSGLRLGRSEVLRSLSRYLPAQSHGHHTIDRLEETGLERGSARQSSLKGRERATVSQTNTGIVAKAALGKLLSYVMERIIIGFSARIDTILN